MKIYGNVPLARRLGKEAGLARRSEVTGPAPGVRGYDGAGPKRGKREEVTQP